MCVCVLPGRVCTAVQHLPRAQKQKAMHSLFPICDLLPLVQPRGEIKRLHEPFLAKRTAPLEAEIAQSCHDQPEQAGQATGKQIIAQFKKLLSGISHAISHHCDIPCDISS